MITKILALVLCAILSAFSLAAADKADTEAKPKDPFKPIPAELQLEISKAQAKLQAIERNSEATVTELWNRIRQDPEYKKMERQRDEAQAAVVGLISRARSVAGVPQKCYVNLDLQWVETVKQGEAPVAVPCVPDPPKPEVKK